MSFQENIEAYVVFCFLVAVGFSLLFFYFRIEFRRIDEETEGKTNPNKKKTREKKKDKFDADIEEGCGIEDIDSGGWGGGGDGGACGGCGG